MYSVGEMIFYSSCGVCQVAGIGKPRQAGLAGDMDYYTLQPVSENHRETIYLPVNTTAYMRKISSARQAQRRLEGIKNMRPVFPSSNNPKIVSDFYSSLIRSFQLDKLLQVVVSLTVKKNECRKKNKHLNQTQATLLKRATDMVCGELAVALSIDRRQAQRQILQAIEEINL